MTLTLHPSAIFHHYCLHVHYNMSGKSDSSYWVVTFQNICYTFLSSLNYFG